MGRNRRDDPREKSMNSKAMLKLLEDINKETDKKAEDKPKTKPKEQLKLF